MTSPPRVPSTSDDSSGGLGFRRILPGLVGFIALGALGVWAVDRLAPGGALSVQGLARAIPPPLLAVCVALAVSDVVLGGVRLHVWIRRVAPGTRVGVSIKTYMVNLFAAAVSPMGSASAPAQLAVLARYGVPPASALAGLLLKFISVLAGFLIVCGAGVGYLARGGVAGTPGVILRALMTVLLAATVLAAVAVWNPHVGAAAARKISQAGARRRGRLARLLSRAGAILERGVSDYRTALGSLRSGWHRPMLASVALSCVMLLNKCLVGYLLARGMGYGGGYIDVAARQSIQWLLIYFSPSPGGSGLAEATVPAFLSGIVPPQRVLEFTVLWRLVTGFVGPALGAVVTLRILRSRPSARPTAAG